MNNSGEESSTSTRQVNTNPLGCHVCLYCHRTFSSASLYANHINRPVARVLYRCHLCPTTTEVGPTPTVTPVLQQQPPSADARTGSGGGGTGNLSAPNLCALYVHMAQWHANEAVSAWRLVPSRLSINAIPWLVGGLTAAGAGAGASATSRTRPASPAPFTTYTEGQELIDLGNDLDKDLT